MTFKRNQCTLCDVTETLKFKVTDRGIQCGSVCKSEDIANFVDWAQSCIQNIFCWNSDRVVIAIPFSYSAISFSVAFITCKYIFLIGPEPLHFCNLWPVAWPHSCRSQRAIFLCILNRKKYLTDICLCPLVSSGFFECHKWKWKCKQTTFRLPMRMCNLCVQSRLSLGMPDSRWS